MAVTIKDVAREARVSVASVSRALNGQHQRDRTNPRTHPRRRHPSALRAAQRGAQPDHPAHADDRRACCPDLHGEFFSELIRGIDLAARARGLHLLVSSSHGDASEAARCVARDAGPRRWPAGHVAACRCDFLRDNLPETLPTVLMNTPVTSAHYPTLNIDNYGGAFAMMQHLIERGHRAHRADRRTGRQFRCQRSACAVIAMRWRRHATGCRAQILRRRFHRGIRLPRRPAAAGDANTSACRVRRQRHDGGRLPVCADRSRHSRSRRHRPGRLRRYSDRPLRHATVDDGARAHRRSRPQRTGASGHAIENPDAAQACLQTLAANSSCAHPAVRTGNMPGHHISKPIELTSSPHSIR